MKAAKKKTVLAVFALALALIVTVGVAFAYFTDYETVRGTASVKLSGNTMLKEEFKDENKIVTIENKGDGDAIVRVGIYGPDGMKFSYENPDDWYHENGDDFWYYKHVLPADGSNTTSSITVSVEGIPKDVELTDMDIIVVHESVPLAVGEDGYYIVPDGWQKVVKAD